VVEKGKVDNNPQRYAWRFSLAYTSTIRNTCALLRKYSGPEVQVCSRVVNK